MDFKKRLESIIELLEKKITILEQNPPKPNITPAENLIYYYQEVINANRPKDHPKKRTNKPR